METEDTSYDDPLTSGATDATDVINSLSLAFATIFAAVKGPSPVAVPATRPATVPANQVTGILLVAAAVVIVVLLVK